jgi:hypothetical protein
MNHRIPDLLLRLAELLEQHDEESWGTALRRLLLEYETAPTEVRAKIRQLYGGMGSFNDLILQDEHGPLRNKNDDLDRLRKELFSICE